MNTESDSIHNHEMVPLFGSLREHVQQQWPQLLKQKHLELELLLTDQVPSRYEIYIGDEFIDADLRCVDVVIRPLADAPSALALPAVLVCEKRSGRLLHQELNGLALSTPVVTDVAITEAATVEPARQALLPAHCRVERCHAGARPLAAISY